MLLLEHRGGVAHTGLGFLCSPRRAAASVASCHHPEELLKLSNLCQAEAEGRRQNWLAFGPWRELEATLNPGGPWSLDLLASTKDRLLPK